MKSRLELTKRFWLKGYDSEYQLEESLSGHQISDLLDRFLKILPPECLQPGGVVQNFKGRDPLNMINTETPAENWPKGDEILFASGRIIDPEISGDKKARKAIEKEDEELPHEDFQLRLHTKFKEFVGAHNITFDLIELRSGPLPESVKALHIGHVFPLEIGYFRIGLDIYEGQFLTNMLGFTPAVTQTLLVECTKETLLLRISAEGQSKRSDLPLQKGQLISKVGSILKDLFNFDLTADYQAQCRPT